VTGSRPFSIEASSNFKRSFKKLAKAYQKDFKGIVATALEALIENPYPAKSREEPLPSRMTLPDGWTFHKLEIYAGKGASGQVRLMYLVNPENLMIKLLWIYSHEQFIKRPADGDLQDAIHEALDG
jgi:mRNA-degrading endonuclease RelE of RelBE toxin-antitoxin system